MKKFLLVLFFLPSLGMAQARLFVAANSDKITCGGMSGITPYGSYSFWIMPSSIPGPGANETIYHDGNNQGYASSNVVIVYINNGGAKQFFFSTALYYPGGQYERANTYTMTAGNWYHVLMTVDPSLDSDNDMKVWVNGSATTRSYKYNTGGLNTNVSFYGTAGIGVQRGSGPEYMDGRLANLCIWAGADNSVLLNTNEITALSRGVNCAGVRPDKLSAEWRLNGLDSPERDWKRRTYTGTITGTTRANGPPTIPRP